MPTFLKVLLLAILGLFTILVVVVLLVALLFDPNDYKPRIEAAVEDNTGRSFRIEGDLELKLFPWLRVTSGPAQLGNAEGFGPEPFARIEAVSAGVRLMPLFRRQVELSTIRLGGMALDLQVDAQGNSNWADLLPEEAQDASPPAEREPGAFNLEDVRIGGVDIRNASVSYRDAQADQAYTLERFNLTLDAVQLGQPANLRFDLALRQQTPQINGVVDGRGVLTLELASERLTMRNLQVNADLRGSPDAPLAQLAGSLRAASLDAAFGAERYALEELQLQLTAVGEPVPATRQEASLQAASLQADLAAGTLALRGLRANALGLAFIAELEGSGLHGEQMTLTGNFEVPQFSPRDTLALLQIVYEPADSSVLTRASLSGRLALAGEDLRLTDLAVQLDDTSLTGSAGIVAKRIMFDLDVDDIDVDRYLPPNEEDAPAPAQAGELDEVEIPVELLRDLNAEGQLRIQEAVLGGVTFRDVVLGVRADNGQTRLNPLRADLYGGSYQGDIRLDVSGEQPRLSLNERVTGVQLGELSQAMFEVERVTGLIQGAFDLNATGNTLGDMRRRLNGEMVFGLTDGAWEGVDVWHQIRTARAVVRQRERPPAPERPRTEFTEVTGTAQVTDGIVDNRDLVALLPFMRLTGQGRINLVEGQLEYRLDAAFLDRPELTRDETMADLRGRRLPLRIDGPLTEPRIRPDFGALVTDEVRDEVRRRAEDLLRDRLRGRQPEPEAAAPREAGEPAEGEPEAEQPRETSEERLRRRLGRILGE
jgi:AsmA protein